MNKLKIAQYIALGATVCTVIGFFLGGASGRETGAALMGIGFMVGLVSYIIAGFGTAFRMARKIAKWGWIIAPFPFDLLTFVPAFVIAVIAFVYLPIIPIRKAYKESMRQ